MRKRRLTQLQDPQERYRNLYMAILDNILEQIPQRFSNLESMLFLELVNPGKFDDMRQAFPEEAFQSVLKSYGHHFDSGRLRSELQVLYSDQDLQSNRGKLCDYLVFLKDMELDSANSASALQCLSLDSASALQTVLISGNNWSYICRCRKELLLFKAAQVLHP